MMLPGSALGVRKLLNLPELPYPELVAELAAKGPDQGDYLGRLRRQGALAVVQECTLTTHADGAQSPHNHTRSELWARVVQTTPAHMAAKIAILSSSLNLNDAGIGEAKGMRSGAGWLRPIVSVALTQAEEEAFRNPVRMKDDAVRTVSSDGGALGMFALLHPAPGGVGRLERLYEPGKGYF